MKTTSFFMKTFQTKIENRNKAKKNQNRFLQIAFVFTLLLVMVGKVGVGQTATYTISSKTAVTTSGTAPSGSSATYSQTYTTTGQMTSGKSTTLTLTGYAGYKITSIVLSMKSNTSAGKGSLSVVAGSTTISSVATGTAFNNANWNGAWSTSYVPITKTPTAYSIQTGENVVITILASANSLYIESYAITYAPIVSTPTITASATSLSGFTYVSGSGPSANQTFTLNGSNLTGSGNITVTGTTNYLVSTDGTTFTSSVTYPYASGIITSQPKTVYVRLKAGLASGNYNSEVINITGGGDTDGATVTCSGSVTAIPSIALADNGTQVVAANVSQGATAQVLHKFKLTVSNANTSLTGLQVATAGTYTSANITNLKVIYSTDASLDAGDVTLSTYTSIPTAGTLTFPSFTSQTINSGSIGYIFITADFAASATIGNTISANAVTTAQLTFSSGTKSGSSTAGGTQTIVALTPTIVLSDNGTQVATASVTQSTSDLVLHKLQLGVSTAAATLTGLQIVTAGTYSSTDLSNIKVRYSSNSTLESGDETLSTFTSIPTAGTLTFPSFTSQTIASGSTGYIFITADISGVATSGHTIRVNAVTTAQLTFSTGNQSGSTTDGGTQTFISGPCVSEGFSGAPTAPTNWDFTSIGGTYTSSTNYGASSPSLKFDATNGRVETPLQSNTATQLKFWIKGQGATGSYLLVEGWDGTAWSTIENILLTSITTGTTKTYNTSSSPALSEIFTKFRFTYTRDNGNLSFDDIEVTCSSSPTINLVGTDPNSNDFNVGSENNQLYRIAATVGGGVNQSITQISYRIDAAATNLNQLVANFKLFYSTNNTLDVSDEQILYSSETAPASANFQTITYSGFSKTILSGSTGYFFITADVISTATIGELLQVSNVTVTHSNTGTPLVSENYAAANTHEIIDSPSDIIAVLGSESDYVSSIINTATNLTTSTGVQVFKFKIRDGGLNGDEDSKPTILTGITLTQNTSNAVNDWSDAILTCALFNESGTRLANGVVTGTQISFTGFTQNILDNDQHIFSVRLSLQPNPNNNGTNLDGDDFVFNITNANATTATSATSSQFGNFSVVNSENGKNVLQVVGTVLEWAQQPSNVGINSIMNPYVKVIAKDANGNIDLGPLTISITSTGTLLSSPLTTSITNGYATFNNIKHTAAATGRILTASASGCSSITSSAFNVLNVTTFKPGELVFVGFDGQTDGSGAHDRYLIATMVDILPGTSFSLVNSRYEAGAAVGIRTDKWGGSGDDPSEAPGIALITYNGTGSITAGSVLNFKTDGAATVFSEIFVITGTTTSANRVSEFSITLPSVGTTTAPNISTSGSDQIYLVQGAFASDGTIVAGEANYILTGNVLHGLTNRVAWVPLSDACSNSETGGNTRESRLPDALKCFNVESAAASSVSGFYENSATHSNTLRNIIIGISDVATNWTLSTSARLSIDPTSSTATKSGKTFTISSTNPAGNWVGDGAGDLTDWFNCHNWEGLTVPTSETDVTIPSTTNLPVIDGATTNTDAQQYHYKAECRNLTIQTSGTLTIGNETDTLYVASNVTNNGTISLNGTTGGQLFVSGNWTNNNVFNAGSLSNVTFNGNNQTITTTGSVETFNHIFFTNGTKSLNKPIIANNLTISDGGILNPNTNGITLSGNWINYNEIGFTESTSNVTFNGALTQNINTTGGEKFYQLTLNKSSEELVALFDVTVENNLNLSDDIFRISDITLTLNGGISRTTGTLRSSSNTSIMIGGTGTLGGLYFTDGAVEIFDLTLNRTSSGSASLTDNLSINNLLTLTNGNLMLNDHTLTINGNSTTTNGAFTGSNSSNLTVNGSGTLDGVVKFANTQTLNNFTLNRNSGIVTMGSNLSVNGNLTLTEAELITTASYTIDLGTLGTIIETPINPISYVTGNIKATRNIGSGSSQTFGGMGLEINEPGSSNTTVVTRITGTSLNGNSSCCASNHSIKRYFQITPSTNSGLNATMKMHYFTHELGGVQESDLAFYKASPTFTGDNWVEKAEDVTRDNSNNWANISYVSGFSEWTLASKTSPLPVELLSFTAQCNNNSASINWTTATELNNSHFNVERSTDGKSWQQIAQIAGAGNSSMPINYTSADNQTSNASIYRLVQVDFDGKSTTYEPIFVNCTNSNQPQISVYPNPSNDHLTIQISDEETQYSIALFDATGKLVMESQTINSGNLELNTATLAPGVYSLKVRSNGDCEVIKVVKR